MRKKAERKERKKKHRILRIISASAAVLVLAVVVQSAIVKSVDASIETVVDVVVKWFEDHVEIKNEVSEYWTTKYDIEPPEYIPSGFELINTIESQSGKLWEYKKQNEKMIISYASMFESTQDEFNSEEYQETEVDIYGYEGKYWISDECRDVLRWNDNEIKYSIEADITLDEMKKIAESFMDYRNNY